MDTYVIMKKRELPMAFTEAEPHMVVITLKEAKNRCQALNQKAKSNSYWHVKVKNALPYG